MSGGNRVDVPTESELDIEPSTTQMNGQDVVANPDRTTLSPDLFREATVLEIFEKDQQNPHVTTAVQLPYWNRTVEIRMVSDDAGSRTEWSYISKNGDAQAIEQSTDGSTDWPQTLAHPSTGIGLKARWWDHNVADWVEIPMSQFGKVRLVFKLIQ